MPQYQLPGANAPDFRALDAFTQGYIEAMFFTENDKDDVPAEAGFSDIAPESLEVIKRDCAHFQQRAAALLGAATELDTASYDLEQAGRDFWFTRNGHGAGFWDRKELEGPTSEADARSLGDSLTLAAKDFREVYLYVGSDKKLHHH